VAAQSSALVLVNSCDVSLSVSLSCDRCVLSLSLSLCDTSDTRPQRTAHTHDTILTTVPQVVYCFSSVCLTFRSFFRQSHVTAVHVPIHLVSVCVSLPPVSVCVPPRPRAACVAGWPRACLAPAGPDPARTPPGLFSLLLLLAPRFWFLSLSCKLQPRSNLSFSLLRYHSIGSHAPCTHLSLARPRALVLGLWFRLRCQPRAPCASRSTPSDSRGACG
jgi:hypothetical protein